MPFYVVEQKGVPGKRLVEADKPAGALNHVVENQFDVKRVDGRELIDAWQECGGAERAGGPLPEPEEKSDGDENQSSDEQDGNQPASNGDDDNPVT